MDKEIIDIAVKLIVAFVSVLITTFVIPWIKSKIDSTKYNDFLTIIQKFVEAANQIHTPEEWKEKKKYVLNLAISYVNKHGIDITMQEIDAVIEGIVKEVKNGI